MFLRLILALVVLVLPASATQAASRGPTVLAAASLQESLTAAAKAWARRGHPEPVLSFAGSSALARQIEAGAPADLFISADENWMDEVARKGKVRAGTRISLLGNSLVLIKPAASHASVTIKRGFPLAAALGRGRLAIADPDAVPAGRYAKAALISLGVWPSVENKLASGEDVRAALAFVERGDAPFGIVYLTDALASSKVRVVGRFPDASHPRISYPLARLASSVNPGAEGFRRFLISPAAKAIFRRFGFTVR